MILPLLIPVLLRCGCLDGVVARMLPKCYLNATEVLPRLMI